MIPSQEVTSNALAKAMLAAVEDKTKEEEMSHE